MEGQKNQNRAMVTWYGQHIRFEQGSCQFLGGRGEGGSFCFQRLEFGGFFVPSSMGLLAGFNIHYLCFYFPLFPFTYLTLPCQPWTLFFLSTKTACCRSEEYLILLIP